MGKSLLSVCSIVFYCHNIKTITGVNHMAERLYTMKDVVDLTGIPATTLRFYDKKRKRRQDFHRPGCGYSSNDPVPSEY